MQVIHVVDKWDDYVIEADDLDKASLGLLTQRLRDDFWYYDEDKVEVERIVKAENGEAAWKFLRSRSEHEYEYVELQNVKSF